MRFGNYFTLKLNLIFEATSGLLVVHPVKLYGVLKVMLYYIMLNVKTLEITRMKKKGL
jgi:hypothetical protein